MSKKFDKLKNTVAKEYEKKGMSAAQAQKIGAGVAGNVARAKGKAPGGRKGK